MLFKIINWLGRSPEVLPPVKYLGSIQRGKGSNLKPIPKWTHAGKKGKTVYCPKCFQGTHVKHFGWSSRVCPKCRKASKKYDWLLEEKAGGK